MRVFWRVVFVLMLACGAHAATAQPASTTAPFVMGTPRPEDTAVGMWMRTIYTEAFRRMNVPVRFEVHPVKRLPALLDAGEIDGETARASNFAQDLTSVVRVEEPVFDSVPALFVIEPSYRLKELGELKAQPWRGAYPRGVVECEKALAPLLSADRIVDVGLTEQAVKMMLSGRVEFVCGLDIVVLAMPRTSEFKGLSSMRKLIDVGDVLPLYPHLNKRHRDLAPVLAATLRQLKGEGLIERYRQEAFRRYGAL